MNENHKIAMQAASLSRGGRMVVIHTLYKHHLAPGCKDVEEFIDVRFWNPDELGFV